MASQSELIKIAREGFDIIEKHFVKRAGNRNFPAPNNRYVYHPQEPLVVYQHVGVTTTEARVMTTGHDAAMFAGRR